MKKYLYFIFFVTLWSCSADKVNVKSEDNSFYSVDLRIIEKTKGTVMSLGDLMESYEIIRLDNRDEALIKTYPYGVYVTDNYILLRPADVVSPVKLFTRKGCG